jgi:hypothetical protein
MLLRARASGARAADFRCRMPDGPGKSGAVSEAAAIHEQVVAFRTRASSVFALQRFAATKH